MLFAVIKEAAEAASTSSGPFHGYPPWMIVIAGTLVTAVVLWIFAKLLKWTIWIVILVVLVGGLIAATRMLTGQ